MGRLTILDESERGTLGGAQKSKIFRAQGFSLGSRKKREKSGPKRGFYGFSQNAKMCTNHWDIGDFSRKNDKNGKSKAYRQKSVSSETIDEKV